MNAVRGNVPEELCALPYVVLLALDHNAMTGSIPACIGSLLYADVLAFSNNLFEGTLPASLGTLTSLEELYIDDNLLEGDPTPVFNGLSGALVLIANNNNFVAEIDSSFLFKTINLTWCDLSQNSFSSLVFPEHLLRFSQLKVLDLSKNRLAGTFPQSIALNTKLRFLGLYENSLSGSLNAISNLTALIHLGK
jgi:LRR receptor-like serine/threonine-protein kinase FLS2